MAAAVRRPAATLATVWARDGRLAAAWRRRLRLPAARRRRRGPREVKRCTPIVGERVGRSFRVHNGRRWQRVRVQEAQVGHRFGQLAVTRAWPKGGRRGA